MAEKPAQNMGIAAQHSLLFASYVEPVFAIS
jgi:hypothetical protein